MNHSCEWPETKAFFQALRFTGLSRGLHQWPATGRPLIRRLPQAIPEKMEGAVVPEQLAVPRLDRVTGTASSEMWALPALPLGLGRLCLEAVSASCPPVGVNKCLSDERPKNLTGPPKRKGRLSAA